MEIIMNIHFKDRNRGFAILLSVLVTGAVSIAVAISLLLLGSDALRTDISVTQSSEAGSLADACAEDALEKIRESFFIGSGSLSLGNGSCEYVVSSTGIEQRTITASGTVSYVVRKVRISVDALNPRVTITSWQEISD